MSKLLLAAVLVSVGCKTYQVDESSSGPPIDAVFQPPPPRQVHGDGEIGLGYEAGLRPDASSGVDGAAADAPTVDARRDAPPSVDTGSPDVASNGGCMACDLLAQDCPTKALGCYPMGGRTCCQLAGGNGEAVSCVDSADCLPSLICAGSSNPAGGTCQRLCSPAAPQCLGGPCLAFGTYAGVGYCAP